MLSLQEGIENAIYIRAIITELMNTRENSLSIVVYVDNKNVTQSLTSTKLVEDKRLRLDIAAIKQCITEKEISGVKWLPGEEQLANCITKKGASGYSLMKVLSSGELPI